jgi:hypothetical protein
MAEGSSSALCFKKQCLEPARQRFRIAKVEGESQRGDFRVSPSQGTFVNRTTIDCSTVPFKGDTRPCTHDNPMAELRFSVLLF